MKEGMNEWMNATTKGERTEDHTNAPHGDHLKGKIRTYNHLQIKDRTSCDSCCEPPLCGCFIQLLGSGRALRAMMLTGHIKRSKEKRVCYDGHKIFNMFQAIPVQYSAWHLQYWQVTGLNYITCCAVTLCCSMARVLQECYILTIVCS